MGVSAGRLAVLVEATKPLTLSAGSAAGAMAARLEAVGALPEMGASEEPLEMVLPLKLALLDASTDAPGLALPADALVLVAAPVPDAAAAPPARCRHRAPGRGSSPGW